MYTQSFGYYALSAATHTECHEKDSIDKNSKKSCCSSKHQHAGSKENHQSCQKLSEKDSCCSGDSHENDTKGGCGGEDCDCHCCFHFHGLQVLYFGLSKSQHLPSVTYYKSKYSFIDALEKDRFSNIFHPPQII